ncbi:MAG: restriction endonuclease [Chloroflexota bacterium]|nr:restriction endonuclease [Chloroflexota bacterium]
MDSSFTNTITAVLAAHFDETASAIYEKSDLLKYINIKTRSANQGSKARGSFGNLYALYVLIEDYVSKGFEGGGSYQQYEGASFVSLFKRQRELPFGRKLQNHALNHRLNEEFKKFFPLSEHLPILRDAKEGKYWINENLLVVRFGGNNYSLATVIVEIIDRYVAAKRQSFTAFIETCKRMQSIQSSDRTQVEEFIRGLMAPNVDARIFEIVSYAILKFYYYDQVIYFGIDPEHLEQGKLKLYKTGRTNANDGGIDFVMRPLGRFFQVTETAEAHKYFLDIDKTERYPITFVVKSLQSSVQIRERLEQAARTRYVVDAIVSRYMSAIEEIITIPALLEYFQELVRRNHLSDVLNEIVKQSRIEFNYNEISEDL